MQLPEYRNNGILAMPDHEVNMSGYRTSWLVSPAHMGSLNAAPEQRRSSSQVFGDFTKALGMLRKGVRGLREKLTSAAPEPQVIDLRDAVVLESARGFVADASSRRWLAATVQQHSALSGSWIGADKFLMDIPFSA